MQAELRLWGDALDDGVPGRELRALLVAAQRVGHVVGLSLTAAARRPIAEAGLGVTLHDGRRPLRVGADITPADLAIVRAAAAQPVAASAPMVAFGGADAVTEARLEHPHATAVLGGDGIDVDRLLDDVAMALAVAGEREDGEGVPDAVLAAFAAMPARPAEGVVAVIDDRDGVVATALARTDARVRSLALPATPSAMSDVRALVLPHPDDVPARDWLPLLASRRPLCVPCTGATGWRLRQPGLVVPLAGRMPGGALQLDPRAIRAAAVRALGDEGDAVAARARRHVLEHHRRAVPRPGVAGERRDARPVVVLEAPLLELSSSSVLTLATARALRARGRVDVRLVPRPPFQQPLRCLREQAPDLIDTLCAAPPPADLWLSAGWPPLSGRPPAGRWAVRLDWEYGALPLELAQLADEVDTVVVHSRAVHATVRAAGVPAARLALVPHGVDDAFVGDGPACARVRAFAAGRPVVLFVGGLLWRKGFDLLLAAVLEAGRQGHRPCLVVKALGGEAAYAGYHLGDLLERVRRQPHAPPVLLLADDLTPADLAAVYRASDVLVHPYRGEGFGLPVLEARACGLPVITTAGGSTDDFTDETTCVRVPAVRRAIELPGVHTSRPFVLEPDAEALARAVCVVLGDRAAWHAAARAAAPDVRSRFGWDQAARRLEALVGRPATIGA